MNDGFLHDTLAPLVKATLWMKILAVISIAQGALSVLTIWGVLIAWLPIWVGVILWGAATRLEAADRTDDAEAYGAAFAKLGSYFKLQGITFLVLTGVAVVGVAAAIAIPLAMKLSKAVPH